MIDNYEFKRVVLSSGIEVFLSFQEHETWATFGVALPCGSRDDGHLPGLHHFAEHWPFDGTVNYPNKKSLFCECDRNGGEMNASTGFYFTKYFCHIPGEYVSCSIPVIADMVKHLQYPEDRLLNNQRVIVQEYNGVMQDVESFFGLEMRSSVFQESCGYRNLVIGTLEGIKNISISDLKAMHQRNYIRENMKIFLTGNFDYDDSLRDVEKYFNNAQPGEKRKPYSLKLNDDIEKERIIKSGKAFHAIISIFSITAVPSSPGHAQITSIFGSMLRGGLSSPIMEWRERSGLFYSCNFGMAPSPDYQQIYLSLSTKPEDRKRAVEEFWEIFYKTLRDQERFDFAIRRAKITLNNWRPSSTRLFDGGVGHLFLYGKITSCQEEFEFLDSIKLKAVSAFIEENFNPENTHTFVCQP